MTTSSDLSRDIASGDWKFWPLPKKVKLLATLRSLRPPMPLLEWVRKYRKMLIPDRPLDFKRHSYLIDIYESTARVLAIFKSSQTGASEYLVSWLIHGCDKRKATALFVFPTSTHVSDFSMARIGPAIEASTYLQSLVVAGRGKISRGADRVGLRRYGSRFMYMRGGKVGPKGQAPQLLSVDADILALDEVDAMDRRAPEIAKKRLGASSIGEERWVSTPTYTNVGIHEVWLKSDQREWFVRCGSCGRRQFMTKEHVILEEDDVGRPVAWHGQPDGTAWPGCEKCGDKLDRLGPGEWVATHPGREIVAFHVTKLFSPHARILPMVEGLDTLNETRRYECTTQDWGMPYLPLGGQLTDDLLDKGKRDYTRGPKGDRCVMGVDVGRDLFVIIRSVASITGEKALRWAGRVKEFSELGPLIRRFGVRMTVVDALPETRSARKFQMSQPKGRVWLAYYVVQKVGSKKEEPVQRVEDEGIVNCDRTRTLDETFGGIYEACVGDPASTLCAEAREIPNYYDHLTAMVRVRHDHNDGEVVLYVSTGDDHYAHAENYASIASTLPVPIPMPDQSKLEKESNEMWR